MSEQKVFKRTLLRLWESCFDTVILGVIFKKVISVISLSLSCLSWAHHFCTFHYEAMHTLCNKSRSLWNLKIANFPSCQLMNRWVMSLKNPWNCAHFSETNGQLCQLGPKAVKNKYYTRPHLKDPPFWLFFNFCDLM